MDKTPIGLRQLNLNQPGRIAAITAEGDLGRRIREMGLTPGTEVLPVGTAPLQDPVALRVRGFTLALRNNEADYISVIPLEALTDDCDACGEVACDISGNCRTSPWRCPAGCASHKRPSRPHDGRGRGKGQAKGQAKGQPALDCPHCGTGQQLFDDADVDVRMALAGNPNCGKTTLFNSLTGARQRVGNYPGITVDKKEGLALLSADAGGESDSAVLVDLPGTYSLSAYTAEELVARDVLVTERPGAVVNVVDATSLERNLYLTVQLLEMGVPMVLALNMMDAARDKGLAIDTAKLAELLDIPVVETVARTGSGREDILRAAITTARKADATWHPYILSYGPDIDPVLADFVEGIEEANLLADTYPPRWTAIKLIEGDPQVTALAQAANPELAGRFLARITELNRHTRETLQTTTSELIADYRYGFINALLKQGVMQVEDTQQRMAHSDAVDKVVTHKLAGPVIMLAVIYAMFNITFTLGEYPMGWLEAFFGLLGDTATAILPEGLFQSLIVSGIIDGAGGVLGFTPLIFIMFVLISILEDLGYMARVAYMLDRVFRVFGLHGCSVMPFIVSGGIAGGCAVPGIMAARTLRSPLERLATIITAPFMVCGAKLPVFLLLVAAFYPGDASWAMFCITLGAWAAALLVSKLLRSTVIKGESTPFVMELPPYRMPTVQGVLLHAWERTWQYIKKAGTVIVAISILLWAAMTFPGLSDKQTAQFEQMRTEVAMQVQTGELAPEAADDAMTAIDNEEAAASLTNSYAGYVGQALEPVSKLAGFDWRTNIALVGGFAAKEVIVSTLGTAYSLGETDPEETQSLSERLRTDPFWGKANALALIIFVLLYAPCFVTVVAMAREASWKWAGFAMAFNTALAFGLAVLVYQVGVRM